MLEVRDAGLPDLLEQSYRVAERLALESDMLDPRLRSVGFYDNGRKLSEDEPELASETFDALTRLGQDATAFVHAKPWKAGLNIAVGLFVRDGLLFDRGIDCQLLTRAQADGKPTTYLEGPLDGVTCFDAAPPREQHELLRVAVRDQATVLREIRRIIDAWRSCNVTELESVAQERLLRLPNLYGCLLIQRSHAWVGEVLKLTQSRERTLVSVGALHCVGDNGLPTLLAKQGLSVSRLR